MKSAVIIFHKNIETLYPKNWVDDCINSIGSQTYKNFDVLELNYGDTFVKKLYPGGAYYHVPLKNHSEAQNWIIRKAFESYDYVFNTNLDDIYHENRIELQMPFLDQGFDIVTSDMKVMDSENKVTRQHRFSDMNLELMFTKDHNIIAHPVCAYSKKLWENAPGFLWENFPKDDFEMWKWAKSRGFKFKIVPEYLLYYRQHNYNVSNRENAAKLINES